MTHNDSDLVFLLRKKTLFCSIHFSGRFTAHPHLATQTRAKERSPNDIICVSKK